MSNSSLPDGWLAHRITPVGYSDLDHRPGFKMSIKEADGRWYLYLAHFWDSGLTVLDVTDPSNSVVLAFIPGPENTQTLQVDLHGSLMVTSEEEFLPIFGGDPTKPHGEGAVFWSLDDPALPRVVGRFSTGGGGTHRNAYTGGKYAHLAANMAGYSQNIYVIVDVSDPANPVEAGRWWVEGQHLAGGEAPAKPGIALHGPAVPAGDLVYLPYGSAGMVVLDISDVSHPQPVSDLPFSPPFRYQFGVHSVVPHHDRQVAYLNSEGVRMPKGTVPSWLEGADHVSVVSIADPSSPELVSVFPSPMVPPGADFGDFRELPAWSGPHNQSQLHHNPDVAPQGDLVYLTYFNAGFRIYDVSNSLAPREVAWFLPPHPTRRYGPLPNDELVRQSEDVLVDRRGFIYVTDKNQGVWILQADLT